VVDGISVINYVFFQSSDMTYQLSDKMIIGKLWSNVMYTSVQFSAFELLLSVFVGDLLVLGLKQKPRPNSRKLPR